MLPLTGRTPPPAAYSGSQLHICPFVAICNAVLSAHRWGVHSVAAKIAQFGEGEKKGKERKERKRGQPAHADKLTGPADKLRHRSKPQHESNIVITLAHHPGVNTRQDKARRVYRHDAISPVLEGSVLLTSIPLSTECSAAVAGAVQEIPAFPFPASPVPSFPTIPNQFPIHFLPVSHQFPICFPSICQSISHPPRVSHHSIHFLFPISHFPFPISHPPPPCRALTPTTIVRAACGRITK